MQFNTYTGAGAQIAAWMVNNPAADGPALGAALAGYDVHEPAPTVAQARALRPWTQRLRAVFEAGPVAEKAELADSLLAAADCRPRLVSHGAGLPFHLHYAPLRQQLTGRVRALTAAGLAHLIDDGHGARLGSCARPGCGIVFIDTSRNGRQRFCSVRCANQVNVARHRSRQREAAARPLRSH
jgi:predicted RNA-binding Zn ribbon-like protein